jgi:hypothetical protein
MGGAENEEGKSITTDLAGNVYTTGFFFGTADFNPDPNSIFNLNATGSNDVFISKLDSTGNFLWAKRVGGSSSDNGRSIAIDAVGNVYATGGFSSSAADFNPDPAVSFNIGTTGSTDAFVLKLKGCVAGDCITTDIEDAQSEQAPLSYPNPAQGTLYINQKIPTQVRISDLTGKALLVQDLKNQQVDISTLQAGIYLLELNSEGATRTERLVVE